MGIRSAVAFICGAMVWAALAAGQEAVTTISHFSGKPVPRFETLRYSAVNGREGPSRNHRILWRYEREGLPVLILKESREWRRVRDPDGDEVWMHARMLTPERHAVVRRDSTLFSRPSQTARVRARIKAGALVDLDRCDGAWCEVESGRRKGWVSRADLWGADASETGV